MNPKDFWRQLDCNGRPVEGLYNTNWVVTSTAQTSTASKTGEANKRHVITDVIASTDLDNTVVTIKSGTTTLASFTIDSAGTFSHPFRSGLLCAAAAAATVTLTGTTATYANLVGFTIPLVT